MNIKLRDIVRTAVVAALAVAFQALNLQQPITGPAINAILYVASIFIGPMSGLAVGLLTPWIALITGIMKLAPAIPVIMAGNSILALVSGYFSKHNRYAAMGLAALLKYIVMTLGVKILIARGASIPTPVYSSLTLTQLVTAISGAVLAAVVLRGLEQFEGRNGRISS